VIFNWTGILEIVLHTTFYMCHLLPQQHVSYRYSYCVHRQRLLKLRREEKLRLRLKIGKEVQKRLRR